MASNVEHFADPIDGHALNECDMVDAVHQWGTEGGRVLINVGDMVDKVNRLHRASACISLLAKDDALPYGGFRIRNPGVLTVRDIKAAIRDSEAKTWTGDVLASASDEYTVAFRPLPRGGQHPTP